MTRRSRTRRFVWHCTLAIAVVAGAGGAYLYTDSRQVDAADRKIETGQGGAVAADAQTSRPVTPPPPPPLLPFNAKLTSKNIPVEGGGVRSGGCSGALIDPLWVITAGHCFHDLAGNRVGGPPPYRMDVTIGKTKDSDPGGQAAQVVEVRQSPVNDLAVVRLSAPIEDITPITLAEKRPPVGLHLQFAGWGSTSATVVSSSDHLKRGQFSISDVDQSTLDAVPLVPRTVENSPCKDDSGSPFFTSTDDVHGELVAIENFGPDCPQPGTEVLARVDVVVPWIRQQISGGAR